MSKPGFIVEGHLEQDFIQATCPGAPVRRIGCNGANVKIPAIAKHVATHARLLQKKCNPIVVVFDRERREETCDCLMAELRKALLADGITAELVIGIPDRDIESWILADFETFAQAVGISSVVAGSFEGMKCKNKIKEFAAGKCIYSETLHGVEWLKKANPHKMKQASASFRRFYDDLQGLSCRWLQQESPLLS